MGRQGPITVTVFNLPLGLLVPFVGHDRATSGLAFVHLLWVQ